MKLYSVVLLPIILLVLMALGGTGFYFRNQISTDLQFIAGLQVSPASAAILVNSYDAYENLSTTYFKLPTCPTATPVCKQSTAVTAIAQSVRAGRAARDALWSLVKANPNANIPVTSFNTLKTAVTALTAIAAQYNISVPASK